MLTGIIHHKPALHEKPSTEASAATQHQVQCPGDDATTMFALRRALRPSTRRRFITTLQLTKCDEKRRRRRHRLGIDA